MSNRKKTLALNKARKYCLDRPEMKIFYQAVEKTFI